MDEADSFIQNRGRPHHSWEVTKVNESVVQIESYDGLFICATNFLDLFASAAFRRFDPKIKFDYLKTEQAWQLFHHVLAGSGKMILQ